MRDRWPNVRLSEVLTLSLEPHEVEADAEYPNVGMYSYARGLFLKRPIAGSSTSAKVLFRVKKDQFIYSRLFAFEGAYGVVPAEFDGAFVSNEYPTFDVDRSRLLPQFLKLYFKQSTVWEAAAKASTGVGDRRQRVPPEGLLSITIPLPSLEDQESVIARVEAIAGKLDEARRLRGKAEEAICALLTSERRHVFGDDIREDWVPLSAYIDRIEAGKSPATLGRPATLEEWGVLKVGAVSFGRFDDRQQKALPPSYVPSAVLEVKPGDFIVSRANTAELVGSCAVVASTRPRLMLSDKTFRLHPRPESGIDVQWLEQVLKAPVVRRQIEAGATGTSPTMKNISQVKLLNLRVPRMHLLEQCTIVDRLEGIEKQSVHGRSASAGIQIGLDALLPAVLDKAFRGEM